MGIPLHIGHDRRRFNRSREGNLDVVVDRRSLLGSIDEMSSAEETAGTRTSRLAFDTQTTSRAASSAPLDSVVNDPSTTSSTPPLAMKV